MHTCQSCTSTPDCATCKLAFLKADAATPSSVPSMPTTSDPLATADEDPSLSERLTGTPSDHSILWFVIIAILTALLVVGFSIILLPTR